MCSVANFQYIATQHILLKKVKEQSIFSLALLQPNNFTLSRI